MRAKNFIILALGPLGAAALGFLSVPLLAWFFTAEDIGRFAMLQTATTFCLLLFSLGLDQYYVRAYHDSANKTGLLLNTMAPGLVILAFIIISIEIYTGSVSILVFGIKDITLDFLVAFVFIGAFISRFFNLALRLKDDAIIFAVNQILPKLSLLVVIGAYFILGAEFTLKKLIFAQLVSVNIFYATILISFRKELLVLTGYRQRICVSKEMLVFSVPLLVGGVLYWATTSADKVFLRIFSSFHELGVYSVALSFAAGATILQSIFGMIWSPWVYKAFAAGDLTDSLLSNIRRAIVFLGTIIFCLVGLFSWVIDFVMPEKYHSIDYIIAACVGAPIFYTMSEVSGIGVGISKRTGLFMLANLLPLAVSCGLNYVLIGRYGASGAAVSTCAALWVFFLLKTELSNFLWRKFPRGEVYILPTLCLVASSAMSLRVVGLIYNSLIWSLILMTAIIYYRDTAQGLGSIAWRQIIMRTKKGKQ